MSDQGQTLKDIVLGAGCFWCVEAVYQQLKGVHSVVSGYSGGHVENPSYEQVCGKKTGHAEVVRVSYDPEVISLEEILEIFFTTHDPTTPDRQGNDVGPQYRSAIFYADDKEKQIAEAVKDRMDQEDLYDAPIVTEISPLINFYTAEGYHQNYYQSNPYQPYCSFVISPKVAKFRKKYAAKLKAEAS
jgi:peptide-methionine (S)-S-oxide reductase